jgi:hypothetical protein
VAKEIWILAVFATVEIEAGKPFDFDKLSESQEAEMALGI